MKKIIDSTAAELGNDWTDIAENFRRSLLRNSSDFLDKKYLMDTINYFLKLVLMHLMHSRGNQSMRDVIQELHALPSYDAILWHLECELFTACGKGRAISSFETLTEYADGMRNFDIHTKSVFMSLSARWANCQPADYFIAPGTVLDHLPGYLRYQKMMVKSTKKWKPHKFDTMIHDYIQTCPASKLGLLKRNSKILPDAIAACLKSRIMDDAITTSSKKTPVSRHRRSPDAV